MTTERQGRGKRRASRCVSPASSASSWSDRQRLRPLSDGRPRLHVQLPPCPALPRLESKPSWERKRPQRAERRAGREIREKQNTAAHLVFRNHDSFPFTTHRKFGSTVTIETEAQKTRCSPFTNFLFKKNQKKKKSVIKQK